MKQKTIDSVILAGLVLCMIATRLPMFGSALHLQDASWALFFLAGFYLRYQWPWAFPLLMITAVAIDNVAIQYMGISNYCVTIAYWFLVPAYASLWLGGGWLRRHLSLDARGIGLLVASLFVSVSVCFFLSNASFYWIGDRIAERTWDGWIDNFSAWYWSFLQVSFIYVGVAAVVHVIVVQVRQLVIPSRMERR